MKYPYGVSSDQHAHNWSQFASFNGSGINTRLVTILNEMQRLGKTVLAAGGDTICLDGDLFHVRGRIEPSVFNPTFDVIKALARKLTVLIIPGNHDLETNDTTKLGNAMQQLNGIDGVKVITEPQVIGDLFMIPWIEDLGELRQVIADNADPKLDLHIHAPLNGVIKGIPDLGLDPDELAQAGYRRVFVGHYHDHKEAAPGVYSIGASTHQTWSDPGTKAGFLLVGEDDVEHHPTNAPLFVNYDGGAIADNAELFAGNFVRMRLTDADEATIKKCREELQEAGAKGIVDHSSRKRQVTRDAVVRTNVTLESAVSGYVEDHLDTKLDKNVIAKRSLEILKRAQEARD